MIASNANIGVIGLAVMGQNLALNIRDHGYVVAIYNRTSEKTEELIKKEHNSQNLIPTYSIENFVLSIKVPRKIILMIKAGDAIDELINQLLPYLSEGDVLIDGGNSFYKDTERRIFYLEKKKINYLGVGISGGEEGARHGPSIMPGGSIKSWGLVEKILKDISAKTPDNFACCEWIGCGGAGHFVKMVHNGIEYGDMQLICETYDIFRKIYNLSNNQMANIFKKWDDSELKSYLIEITSIILNKKDIDNSFLVNQILDIAEQKGTGKWAVNTALDLFENLSLISEAVYARNITQKKSLRQKLSMTFTEKTEILEITSIQENDLKNALYIAKIISYAQGFSLLLKASIEYKWNLNLSSIAKIWRSGCIIRSVFLDRISEAFYENSNLEHLFLNEYFFNIIQNNISSLRNVIILGAKHGVPLPAFMSALSYYDSLRSNNLPANLLQAQRDFFGSHLFQKTNDKEKHFYHVDWTT